MDQNLRDLLDTAAGEPPRPVTSEAVRRRVNRRRAAFAATAIAGLAVAVGLGSALAAGSLRTGPAPAAGGHQHAGPPRYYLAQDWNGATRSSVTAVRSTATGRITADLPSPAPGENCDGGNAGLAAADGETFFVVCTKEKLSAQPPANQPGMFRKPGTIRSIETLIYRFRLTGAGHVTGYSLVSGGVLKGVWTFDIAASPDGSLIAAEVAQPVPPGRLYTNTIPEGIVVIDTRTGHRALWRTGPGTPGAASFALGTDLSFTSNDRQLVVLESLCPRTRYQSDCSGHADMQLRAYSPAAAGGSLAAGRVLLDQSALRPARTSLSDAFITQDGFAATAVLIRCPRHGTCTLSAVRMSVATGRVLRVLYQTRTGTAFQGVFERFFSADPSGRYLILDAGAGRARLNGWIDHGKLTRLVPADGSAPGYETW
jgi:hypothetical protein